MRALVFWATTMVASGCAHEQQAVPPPTVVSAQESTLPSSVCPFQIPGAQLSTEQTDDGIALIFTTDEQAVYPLRERVLQMAQHYNQQNIGPKSAPSTARVVYTGEGAKMLLAPVNPADLPALRANIQMRAQQMAATKSCSAM